MQCSVSASSYCSDAFATGVDPVAHFYRSRSFAWHVEAEAHLEAEARRASRRHPTTRFYYRRPALAVENGRVLDDPIFVEKFYQDGEWHSASHVPSERRPIVLRRAMDGEPITYDGLNQALIKQGEHGAIPIAYRYVAGKIGDICEALSKDLGEHVPPLNAIIINAQSKLPSQVLTLTSEDSSGRAGKQSPSSARRTVTPTLDRPSRRFSPMTAGCAWRNS